MTVEQKNDVPAVPTHSDQLEALASQLNEAVREYKENASSRDLVGRDLGYRRKIAAAASQILNETKAPEEQWNEQSVAMAEFAAIRCFMHWGAFEHIPLQGSITYKALAAKIGAEESLITRIAWMMVSTGTLKQIGDGRVAHTRLSKVYVGGHPSGVFFQMMFDEFLLPWAKWPRYFDKYGLKEANDPFVNPHTFSFNEAGTHFWDIIFREPKRMAAFMQSMNTLEQLLPITGMYDFKWLEQKAGTGKETPLLVDVGGGKGQALKAIFRENPGIDKTRCYLQDLPNIIAQVETEHPSELDGVKKMGHDFFTEQPVKGAYIYYIRRCLHDWSDENCAKILSFLRRELHPDGRILITEQVMTNPPSRLTAQTDLCVLNIGGKERTEENFRDLAGAAGLKIVGIHKAQATDVAVIECIKAEGC